MTAFAGKTIYIVSVNGQTQRTFALQLMGKEFAVRRKRFLKRSELVKQAVANAVTWTKQELLCRNVLQLNGINNPSLETVQRVILQQQIAETNRKYKELTKECIKQ